MPRTNFNSSRLIRVLADLSVVDATEPGHAFAERLGRWLDFTDAIALFAVHNASSVGSPDTPSGEQSVVSVAVGEEFARIRAALVSSIRQSCSPKVGQTRIKLPTPTLGVPIEIAAAYEPYRRFYLAHQRDIDLSVRPLRANVRQALSTASSALKKLADLDAALDQILGDRESKLLAKLPLLLERRFEQRLKTHRQMLVDTQQADNPALWMQAEGWLEGFCTELQTVLLAELDLRLQPTVGLIEAFSNETSVHK